MGFSGAIMVAGAAASAVGSANAARAQKQMLEAQSTVGGYQASQALDVGQAQAQQSMLKYGGLYGAQRAQLAANGVDLGSGSALDLLTSTKYVGQRDAATISDNALRTAWGYQTGAAMDTAAASNISPTGAAVTSLLGSSGQVANAWYSYKRAGGAMGSGGGGATVPAAGTGGEF